MTKRDDEADQNAEQQEKEDAPPGHGEMPYRQQRN